MLGTASKLLAALVGGVIGIALIFVLIAGDRLGIGLPVDGVLQLLGILLAAGLALAGSFWIERHKRRLETVDEARPVLDALLLLEDRSRPSFALIRQRDELARDIDRHVAVLDRMLERAPPRDPRILGLIYDLRFAAAYLTSDAYLTMNSEAPLDRGPQRQKVEKLLETFDTPLKLLILRYSRLVDPRSRRAMQSLGSLPG